MKFPKLNSNKLIKRELIEEEKKLPSVFDFCIFKLFDLLN